MSNLAIVCGFRAEAHVAALISNTTACGWKNPGAAETLVQRGATALLSFGLAGALDPALVPGDILIPDHVLLPGGTVHHCDSSMVEALRMKFPQAQQGAMFAGRDVIASAPAKRDLFARTQAVAIDMESVAVAEAASAHSLPFCVFRVVADTATDTLPPAALEGLKPDGTTAYGRIFRSVLREPGQVPALMRLGMVSHKGMEVLRRSALAIQGAIG